jgi:hypothetical protein
MKTQPMRGAVAVVAGLREAPGVASRGRWVKLARSCTVPAAAFPAALRLTNVPKQSTKQPE